VYKLLKEFVEKVAKLDLKSFGAELAVPSED
jgi:hypothetical protein